MTVTAEGFDMPLSGAPSRLLCDDGTEIALDVDRWADAAGGCDDWLVRHCTGPTVDLGCGPGRLLVALAARGIAALGVDGSAVSRVLCHRRGVPMVRPTCSARCPARAAGPMSCSPTATSASAATRPPCSPAPRGCSPVVGRCWWKPTRVPSTPGAAPPVSCAAAGRANRYRGRCRARSPAVTAGRAGLRVTDVHLGARVFLELTRS